MNSKVPSGLTMQVGTLMNMSEGKIYKKKVTVIAQMITLPATIYLANGKQDLSPGDFLITDPGTSTERPAKTWGCQRDEFNSTYEPVESGHAEYGRFRKKARIRALELKKKVLLNIIDSDAPEFGEPGDWLVCNLKPDGTPMTRGGLEDRYIIRASEFAHLYEEDVQS